MLRMRQCKPSLEAINARCLYAGFEVALGNPHLFAMRNGYVAELAGPAKFPLVCA